MLTSVSMLKVPDCEKNIPAIADAIAATVLVSPSGAAVSANGIFDGGVTATSHAAGISGDGIGHDQNTTATVIVESVDDVRLNTLISTEAASGNDTITNDGKISATSVAVAPAGQLRRQLVRVSDRPALDFLLVPIGHRNCSR